MAIATAAEGEIILGGTLFKLASNEQGGPPGVLQVQELGTFPRKITIGDPTKDSQDYRSVWIINDLTGGHGISDHQLDATVNRYRYSSFEMTHPNAWTTRPLVSIKTGTAGVFWPLGDLLVSGNIEMYSAFGTDVHLWNETTDAWTDTTRNLTSAPVNNGVAFAGTGTLRLFIPCGATGYATETGAALVNVAASGTVPAAREFVVFGTLLICLDTSNQLWSSIDGTAWTSYGADGKIDASLTANRIDTYRDSFGNPSLVIATNGGVWVFDPQGPTLYQQDLQYPIHPDQGLAATVWRGEYYVSVGMGLHKWNSTTGTIDAMGLDRDDGLPMAQQSDNRLIDLFGAYNELYALTNAGAASIPSLHKWTGQGWHECWSSANPAAATTRIYVSQARSTYRVWWGQTSNLTYRSYTIELDRGFTNPKTVTTSTATNGLGKDAQLYTGMNDMGMAGYKKIAHSAKMRVAYVREDLLGTTIPELYYRIRESDAWTLMYEAAGIVRASSTAALDYTTINFWFKEDRTGVAFDEIELGLYINNQYAVVKFLTMDFIKIPRLNKSWTATLDVTSMYDGKSPESQAAVLETLIDSDTITTMVHRGTTYYVRLASWNGADNTGMGDNRSIRSINIIEMRYEDNA